MIGAALIAEARAAGVHLSLIGDDRLTWACDTDPPPDLLARLKANKTAVLAALRSADWLGPGSPLEAAPTPTPADEAFRWRHHYEERAGLREHDGGISRAAAEAAALADCAQQWRCENPLEPNGPTDPCRHCNLTMTVENATPVLAGTSAHAWTHAHCWAPMRAARQQQSLDAVRALLVVAP